jgi:hypothetical protein
VTPAALARVAGAAARIEAKLGGAPADLAQGRARTTVAVEALALLRDAATLESDSWLSEINLTTIALGRDFGVRFDGEAAGRETGPRR